jgi:deoxyribodipyrimidine photolyase-related protein
MSHAVLLFPHQLFEQHPLLDSDQPVYLVEEQLFFHEFDFHRMKIAFHRGTMQHYQQALQARGIEVHYVDAQDQRCDVRVLIEQLAAQGISAIDYIDPVDNWLEKRIRESADSLSINARQHTSPMFFNSLPDLEGFFKVDKQFLFQTAFYKQQRKSRDLLLDGPNQPAGGKWTFDADNRKKYPKKTIPPALEFPPQDNHWREALDYTRLNFAHNPGALHDAPLYPLDHAGSRRWLDDFLHNRFHGFGDYEDAIVTEQTFLHHSVLSPLLNAGLLTPAEVIDRALEHARQHQVPINSVEGFIRQIVGWREFIRGVYQFRGSASRTHHFWGFKRKIPSSFYDATTGIPPVDNTIKKVLDNAYCHHIERLMILGNFMLLCEFDPDEVYRWFMELFIDAYDWVMVPNVYGMSQFADGGLFATKPYISGSNYLMKMSDYPRGEWQQTWDGLFWRFMHEHREFFGQNPRLGMLLRSLDRMAAEKRDAHLAAANRFLREMDKQSQV